MRFIKSLTTIATAIIICSGAMTGTNAFGVNNATTSSFPSVTIAGLQSSSTFNDNNITTITNKLTNVVLPDTSVTSAQAASNSHSRGAEATAAIPLEDSPANESNAIASRDPKSRLDRNTVLAILALVFMSFNTVYAICELHRRYIIPLFNHYNILPFPNNVGLGRRIRPGRALARWARTINEVLQVAQRNIRTWCRSMGRQPSRTLDAANNLEMDRVHLENAIHDAPGPASSDINFDAGPHENPPQASARAAPRAAPHADPVGTTAQG